MSFVCEASDFQPVVLALFIRKTNRSFDKLTASKKIYKNTKNTRRKTKTENQQKSVYKQKTCFGFEKRAKTENWPPAIQLFQPTAATCLPAEWIAIGGYIPIQVSISISLWLLYI